MALLTATIKIVGAPPPALRGPYITSLQVGGRLFQQVRELPVRRLAPRGHVLARPDPLGRPVVLEYRAGHRLAVHLVRPVVDAGSPRVPVHLLQREVRGVAQ